VFVTEGTAKEPADVERRVFKFEDPRQAELYDLLRRLVGEGPASFYRDACNHMVAEPPMEALTHQVGHLAREIDGGLLNMLGSVTRDPEAEERDPLDEGDRRERVEALLEAFNIPVENRVDKIRRVVDELTKQSRSNKVLSVLGALDLPTADAMARSWVSPPGGSHKWAHRDSLLPPRRPDDQFRLFWERMQEIWYTVLTRFETRFTNSFSLMDRLLKKNQPTKEDVGTLRDGVPNTVVAYEYFFSKMTDARWLSPLSKKGFFAHPPGPETDEDGTVRVPPWPQASLLARMADKDPEMIKQIILDIPSTENVRMHEAAAEAAQKMHPQLAAELVPKALEGLDAPFYSALARKLSGLAVHLAGGGLSNQALNLARELLSLVPETVTPQTNLGGGAVWPATVEPRPRFRPPEDYDPVVSTCLMPLLDAAGEEALDMLCDLLEESLRISLAPYQEEGSSDFPYRDGLHHAMPAIEGVLRDEDYELLREEPKLRLFIAVRDAAQMIGEASPAAVPRLVVALEDRGFETFDRLALHLLRKFPDARGAPALIIERLTRKLVTVSDGLWGEYATLLREHYAKLPGNVREAILRGIREGPPREDLEEIREWRRTRDPDEELTEEELDAYSSHRAERWRLRRLAVLGDLLPEEDKAALERLRERYGTTEDLPYYKGRRVVSIVPRGSPKSADELRTMPFEEVVSFLANFEPIDGWEGPDARDVAQELEGAVATDPSRFAVEAERFRCADPTYVHAVLRGLRDAVRKARKEDEQQPSREGVPSFPWRSVLALCHWILDQPRLPSEGHYARSRDVGWGPSLQSAAELVRDGLLRKGEVPFELRDEVWAVLGRLAEDPELTLEYEEVEAKLSRPHTSPHFFSINTVRGVAMHAVVAYVLWVRRNLGEDGAEEREPWRGLLDAPEACEALERRLDPGVEPTRAVRAVYGYWLPWLVYLDRAWVEERLPQIFPIEEGRAHLRDAAWEAYVAHQSPYDEVFEVLRGEYAWAVERLVPDRPGGQHPDPDKALAEHLMILYWTGTLALDETHGLLRRFYENASDELRAHAAGFIGQLLRNRENPLPEEQRSRLEDLWSWRLDRAAADADRPHSRELGAFGRWFASGKLDDWRALQRFNKGISLGADFGRAHAVVERLAEVTPAYPALAAECSQKIVRILLSAGSQGRWALLGVNEHLRDVFVAAMSSGDEAAVRTARGVANVLVANGFDEFERMA
jgi:hypothetical protein